MSLAKSKRGGTASAQRVRAADTLAAIIASARALFAEHGYHATGTNEVVARAAVTRGALYHHFTGKLELFEAVFRQICEELNAEARTAVQPLSGDLWGQIAGAFTHYLKMIAANAEFQRILLIDGPAVLGWGRWRYLQSEYVGLGTADAFRMLMQQGIVEQRAPEPLANLIQAALNDAALSIAHAPNPRAARIAATDAFIFLLGGLRYHSSKQP